MKVGVLGGGIAGLAATWALARGGHAVTLLERDPRVGGKIRTLTRAGFRFEAGPDSFLTTKPHALELCRALGLEDELVRAAPGPTYVWSRGRLYRLPRGTRLLPTRLGPLLASDLLTPLEKARAAFDLFLPGGGGEGDESLASLVGRRMGRAVVDRIAAPLLAGIHAADPERLSVHATFPALRDAERSHGSLMRGLGAQAEPAPSAPPFATLAGGLERLVERLVASLTGVDLRTDSEVTALIRHGSGWRIAAGGAPEIDAEAIVVAVPSWAAAPLLAPHAPRAAALLGAVEWVSTAVVTLGYHAGDAPPLAGHGFVVARDQPARITGCTWVSAKWPGRAPEGTVLLRAYLGHAGDPLELAASDEALAALARADLARAIGLAAEPILVDVARWPRAMPQLEVGHLARLEAAERELARLPRIALAGAGYRGSGIPDCVAQALRAADLVTSEAADGVLQKSDRTRV